jgi:hypothetical protein
MGGLVTETENVVDMCGLVMETENVVCMCELVKETENVVDMCGPMSRRVLQKPMQIMGLEAGVDFSRIALTLQNRVFQLYRTRWTLAKGTFV